MGSVLRALHGKQETSIGIKTSFSELLMEWLNEKWILRCNLAAEKEKTREKERLMEVGVELWNRGKNDLVGER